MTAVMSPEDQACRFWGAEYQKRHGYGHAPEGTVCCFCGRDLVGDLQVEYPPWEDALGWFPVGPECARKARRAGLPVR